MQRTLGVEVKLSDDSNRVGGNASGSAELTDGVDVGSCELRVGARAFQSS